MVLIKDVGLQTVPLALTQFKGQFASDYPKQMAAMLITMAPIVVLYFAFSKQIINGMVAGAVKDVYKRQELHMVIFWLLVLMQVLHRKMQYVTVGLLVL